MCRLKDILFLFFAQESVSPEFVGMPPLNCWSKVKETRLILIYTMMHQHFLWPGSMWVCQHLAQPVRVNRLADMTCPAPVIELLTICLPWLSCCHISVNLIVAAAHHILIRCDRGIKGHFVAIMRFFFLMGRHVFCFVSVGSVSTHPFIHLQEWIHTHRTNSEEQNSSMFFSKFPSFCVPTHTRHDSPFRWTVKFESCEIRIVFALMKPSSGWHVGNKWASHTACCSIISCFQYLCNVRVYVF